MRLILTDTNIKKAHPGDIIEIQGVILPKRKESSQYDQDIIFDSFMEAFKVTNQKKRYVDMDITEEDRE
jgi:DNA replicative helicase MCM subunit Mcm2 (Cdc46/Mcm family)